MSPGQVWRRESDCSARTEGERPGAGGAFALTRTWSLHLRRSNSPLNTAASQSYSLAGYPAPRSPSRDTAWERDRETRRKWISKSPICNYLGRELLQESKYRPVAQENCRFFSIPCVTYTMEMFYTGSLFWRGGGIVSMIINNIIYQRIPKTVRPHQLVKPWKSFLPLENTLKQDFPSYH